MSNLIIKRLFPRNDLKFVLEGELYGDKSISPSFSIKVPPACELIRYSDIFVDRGPVVAERATDSNQVFFIAGFSKQPYNKRGFYNLRFRLVTEKDRKSLKAGETVRLITPDSRFTKLTNKDYIIIRSGKSQTGRSWVVDLEIPNANTLTPTSGTLDRTNSYIREITYRRDKANFTITIPKDSVYDNLVNFRSPATGNATYRIRDVPIYAYKNFEGENTSDIKKNLFYGDENNPTIINDKTPPIFGTEVANSSMIVSFTNGNSYTKRLNVDEKPKFAFYVAIARYTLRNSKWTGEWLQKNKNGNAIWGVAKKRGT